MDIDIQTLIRWLSQDGTIAGLEKSDLTILQLQEIAEKYGLKISSKQKRSDIIQVIIDKVDRRIDKPLDDLLKMNYESLKEFLIRVRPSNSEIVKILLELDIRPGSEGKRNLIDFAAREISDIGMYSRVARGRTAES